MKIVSFGSSNSRSNLLLRFFLFCFVSSQVPHFGSSRPFRSIPRTSSLSTICFRCCAHV
ncbi:hypothetical protein PR003_g152 [Phytophthora rubi]|uniref:RxLR effector protein n=1 Tax=Phytophthora rubi TaxID=129364 RepID=A0A6A4G9H9_9STRA|nr:hypothetical protein PR002_g114 [Phytophthora rubi]KAE9052831.1 hypothetical protein PR001_g152 [Phytophthora rubi]KAE9360542.1 hypothetical protein PR003_g152 [Phytophthora rubi]